MPQTYADHAVAAYTALQQSMYAPDGTSLYTETAPATGNPYSYLWPLSRALIGTLALAGVPAALVSGANYRSAVQDRLAGLAKYWDGAAAVPAYDSYVVAPLGGGGDKYYDDNAWVSLALIQQYRMGLTTSLEAPKQLFKFAQLGWDRTAKDPDAGGVEEALVVFHQPGAHHDVRAVALDAVPLNLQLEGGVARARAVESSRGRVP